MQISITEKEVNAIDFGLEQIRDVLEGSSSEEYKQCSAATNTGDYSAASGIGKDSIAIVTGKESKAKGSIGCWIVLTERGEWDGETYPIIEVKAFKVDGVSIKENTYYSLVNGKPVECE